MTRRGIHHLVVVEDGTPPRRRVERGLPAAPARRTRWCWPARSGSPASVDELARLGVRVTALVRRLVDEGGTAYDVGRIVAELNDRMTQRVLDLATQPGAPVGPAPVPFCWLAFGSEARQEQALRTDQDNGLAYEDPSPADAAAVAELLRASRRRGQRGAGPDRVPGVPGADHGIQPGVVPAGRRVGAALP